MRTQTQKEKDAAAAALLARQMILQDSVLGPMARCLETGEGRGCEGPGCGVLERLEKLHSRLKRKPKPQRRLPRSRKPARPEIPITFTDWIKDGQEEKT
jgi:hypothetical protein